MERVGTRAKAIRRWNPKNWKPEYEAIVALSATGMPNSVIAKRYGYTESWLSSILNCEQAKIIQQMIINKTREASVGNIPERLRFLQAIAVKRVEDTLNNDKLAERSPMAIFDRSMAFLKSGGIVAGGDSTGHVTFNQHNNTLIISEKDRSDLRDSLMMSEKVKMIHGESISNTRGNRPEQEIRGTETQQLKLG